MANFTGMFDTSQFAPNLAKLSFAQSILRLMPNGAAPLFALSGMLKSETAVQQQHGYYTKTMLFPSATLAAAVTDGTSTIFTVLSTANLLPNMILQAAITSENVIIDQVLSPTQISVTRGVGTIAAAAIANSTELFQVGTAFEQGSVRPNALNIQPVQITNLTQIFRNTWAVTETARATLMIAGDGAVAESRQDCAAFHAADIEKAIIYGQKSTGTRNGRPFNTMDGLVSITNNLSYYPSSYAAANVFVAGVTTSYTQLENMLDPCFNQNTNPQGANERWLFVGGTAKKVLTAIGRLNGNVQLIQGQQEFGFQFDTFKISRGSFRIVEHPLLNSNVTWSKMAIAVDLRNFNLAYLGDRKTTHTPFGVTGNGGDAGYDAQGGTLTTELTTVIKNPPANAVIFGLTAGYNG